MPNIYRDCGREIPEAKVNEISLYPQKFQVNRRERFFLMESRME